MLVGVVGGFISSWIVTNKHDLQLLGSIKKHYLAVRGVVQLVACSVLS